MASSGVGNTNQIGFELLSKIAKETCGEGRRQRKGGERGKVKAERRCSTYQMREVSVKSL